MHIVQEGRRDTLAWTFFVVQGVGDMLFERLPEPVDALHTRNNTLRSLVVFHRPHEVIFCMTHVKGFQTGFCRLTMAGQLFVGMDALVAVCS